MYAFPGPVDPSMRYDHINVPADGAPITANPNHSLNVPDFPVIPFIEGDCIGINVTPVMLDVVNVAVEKPYGKNRATKWMQVYAGAKAVEIYGENEVWPDETVHASQKYMVSIKGLLSIPTVGCIGIAPGANFADSVGVFETTHGTAPGFAGKDRVNPGSLILSAAMLLRYIDWDEATDLIVKDVGITIANGELTFDLARLRGAIQ